MIKPIDIYNQNTLLKLREGKHYVDFLGGWSVNTNGFRIVLKNINTGKLIKIERTFWPVQNFEFGKRSLRYFEFHIPHDDTYSMKFIGSNNIQIKRSNVPFFSLLSSAIANMDIMVYIHRA